MLREMISHLYIQLRNIYHDIPLLKGIVSPCCGIHRKRKLEEGHVVSKRERGEGNNENGPP